MKKPKHPGRTAAQRKALDAIGCGDSNPFMHPRTRDALLAEGLIVKLGDEVIARDRFGEIKVPVYEMPVPVHIRWCEAVAEEIPEGS